MVRAEILPNVLVKSAEYRLRVGASLIVLRLVDPANDSTCVGQDCRRNGLPRNAGWSGVDGLVTKPVEVRDFEFPVGEHGGF